MRQSIIASVILLLTSCIPDVPESEATFNITIENLSTGDFATPLSPGVYLLKKQGFPLFTMGNKDFGIGLLNLSEDGVAAPLRSSLETHLDVLEVGSFGMIPPGRTADFTIDATYGTFLNFATMFMQSNDLFYSFDQDGIHLFEPNGSPISGDVTRLVWLWDLGSEQNEIPFEGQFQPPRQEFRGQGNDEDGVVRIVNDEFTYPTKFSVIRVTVTPVEP